jgi:hypothetical protein
MNQVTSFFIINAALLFVASNIALAQNEEILQQLPEDIAAALKGKDLRAVAEGRIAVPTPNYKKSFKSNYWESELPVTLHLRGSAGQPIPTPASTTKAIKRETISATEKRKLEADIDKLIKSTEEKYKKLPELKTCTKDTNNLLESPAPSDRGIETDILFLLPEQMPQDPGEVFGKGTIAIPYDVNKPVGPAFNAISLKITCLPSRIRILGRGVARLTGLPALKNYETEPYGAGFLHESMRSKVLRIFDETGKAL